jgi:tripartite-type tricarboxylate transporter receptor subunit TctC
MVIACVLLCGLAAAVEGFPRGAVTVICPWSPGGGNDRVARFIAEELQKEYKVPFNVVNRTGGNGVTGHSAIANARPNGQTIGTISHDITTMKLMGLTELEPKDFEFITQVTVNNSSFMVTKDSPFTSVNDIMDTIKANPGQLKLAGTAVGGPFDLMRLFVMREKGMKPDDVKFIPSKGASAAIVEVLGGHADFTIANIPEALSQLDSGDIVALSVSSETRNPAYPKVPTLKEQGIDVVMGSWVTIGAPLGTPKAILDELQEKIVAIMTSPAGEEFMRKNAFVPGTIHGDALKAMAMETAEKYKDIMEYAGYLKK